MQRSWKNGQSEDLDGWALMPAGFAGFYVFLVFICRGQTDIRLSGSQFWLHLSPLWNLKKKEKRRIAVLVS